MTPKKATHATPRDDAQASQDEEGQAAAPATPAAAPAPGTGGEAAVAAAPAPAAQAAPPVERDEHHGQGGAYRRQPDGTRTLIERTQRQAPAGDASAPTTTH